MLVVTIKLTVAGGDGDDDGFCEIIVLFPLTTNKLFVLADDTIRLEEDGEFFVFLPSSIPTPTSITVIQFVSGDGGTEKNERSHLDRVDLVFKFFQ